MDNLTHSLTGAVVAKFIETRPTAPEEKKALRRTFFWLFVLTANLPDVDVLLGLIGDPIFSIRHHRGITHSLIVAPFFALLPVAVFRLFSKVKNIRLLWVVSLLGIVTHIFFDLVTSFGTQILAPVSERRYALDWMFIIDPLFTVLLAAGLALPRFFPGKRTWITSAAIAFVVLYVVAAASSHHLARVRVQESLGNMGIGWTRVSVLPQPPTLLHWHGLVQTEGGVWEAFFSIFDSENPKFRFLPHTLDDYVPRTEGDPDVQWYLTFARHPSIRSYDDGDRHIVEFRDMMFSLDAGLVRSLGFTERSIAFVLSYAFDREGKMLEVQFDGKKVR